MLTLAVPLAYVVWRAAGQLGLARLRWLVFSGVLGAAAIAPITLRNYLATGTPVALVGHGGINLYIGNGRGATGSYRVPEDIGEARDFNVFRTSAERLVGKPLTDKEADDYWKERTVREVLEDPFAWLRLMVKKTHLFLNGREIPDVYDLTFYRKASPLLGAPLLQLVCIAPFAWVGLWFLRRHGSAGSFVLLTIGSYAAGIVAVFVIARYRLPIVCALFVSAGATFEALRGSTMARGKRELAASLAALALALWVAWPVRMKELASPATAFFELGAKYHGQKRLDRAQESYQAALRLDPRHVPTRNNLALLYESQQNYPAALHEWKAVLVASPDHGSPAAQRAQQHIRQLSAASPR
jgi:tetratricopeptide (TPR) repeat protein